MNRHVIGLLLGMEEDWPTAFETLIGRLGPVTYRGERYELVTERIVNEPFDLRYTPRYSLVIDRLAWWYYVPREWLKKIALMDDVYLPNNPFTFQAMEKHSAYCAMMRLGLKVPSTWLIPHRQPLENPRFAPTAERYNAPFDLGEVAARVGYPLYMKPFDGGAWAGVTRIADADELQRGYESSGTQIMHLQAAVADYDVFTRSLSIGPQTMVMHYDPTQEHHFRYVHERDFVSPELERELMTISLLVNAFFRWEFNSCEVIVKDGEGYPIDYANASPDIALTSLQYYFPWALESLLAWCVFATITRRSMRLNQSTRAYFEIGDDEGLAYEEKLDRYRELADDYHQVSKFEEFRATALARLGETAVEYFGSTEFDKLLVDTVVSTEPERLQEMLIDRVRGFVAAWVADRSAALSIA